jgi:type I restriction enzyme M protein
VPPARQGDYAYLLHIVRSLKSTGKGACILPHGVLFRGNAKADIRRALVRKGYIKGIIGLPANLFYGTGIPACIIVADKQDAHVRKGIFMIDASQGFMKDGPKNRLRAQDIHKIVDVFNKRLDVPKYAHTVPFAEIEKNEFNLNLPRYIDSQTPEDLQEIAGHLQGGIHAADIDALARYWAVCPRFRQTMFKAGRPGYLDLAVEKPAIKRTIYENPEFAAFIAGINAQFAAWRKKSATKLKTLQAGFHPKEVIAELSDSLLTHYAAKPLIDPYEFTSTSWITGPRYAGRLLPDRRRWLEGRDHAHHRERQEGQGEGQGLDLRPRPEGFHRRPLFRQGAAAPLLQPSHRQPDLRTCDPGAVFVAAPHAGIPAVARYPLLFG